MNIDKHLLYGLKYFKKEAKKTTYYSIDKANESNDIANGTVTIPKTEYPVKVLLQRYESEVINEVMEVIELLCIIYGKIAFIPKDGDFFYYEDELYIVQKIYRNVSKTVVIVSVRKQS